MFLRASNRKKDGKDHRYWSIVENRRVAVGKTVQKTLLYLGEINDSQRGSWCKAIEAIDGEEKKQINLFPSDRTAPESITNSIQIKMSELSLERPRQWGACWLCCTLWEQLELDEFWGQRLSRSRKGTEWLNVLKTLVAYRLIDPGSEWRLHRLWFDQSAMGDLLGEDFQIAQKNTLYRCLDKILPYKEDLFQHLRKKWAELFEAEFEILLYDLTSTYFESNPPFEGKRQFGYSRDKRSDCVQVVIALVVTTEGFPLAYEVMPGNTSEKTTLRGFLQKIENQYGKAKRTWVMDRGIPTEEVLEEMRKSDPPVEYLVGTPRGRLSTLEKDFLALPWEKARESVEVKLLEKEGELYILAKSRKRVHKERAMRMRKLKKLWKRLKELQKQTLTRDELLIKLGGAKKEATRVYHYVDINIPKLEKEDAPITFTFSLNKKKLKVAQRREGSYLLRSNSCHQNSALLWERYVQLTEIEQAFRDLKSDLAIRPIFHQTDERIDAHIFIAFLSYCLFVTLRKRCKSIATGLSPRSVLEQLKNILMLDVSAPTTDGRWIKMSRYTKPDKAQNLILAQLKLILPKQPPPQISALPKIHPVVKTF